MGQPNNLVMNTIIPGVIIKNPLHQIGGTVTRSTHCLNSESATEYNHSVADSAFHRACSFFVKKRQRRGTCITKKEKYCLHRDVCMPNYHSKFELVPAACFKVYYL